VTSTWCARPAHETRALLDELGFVGHPKTTGNRGIHVYVRLEPRWDSYQVRSAAVAVARELERRRAGPPHRRVVEGGAGRAVFVDFNQNAPHKTVFGAWCVRARPAGRSRHRSPGTSSTASIPTT
jgi:DNA primase